MSLQRLSLVDLEEGQLLMPILSQGGEVIALPLFVTSPHGRFLGVRTAPGHFITHIGHREGRFTDFVITGCSSLNDQFSVPDHFGRLLVGKYLRYNVGLHHCDGMGSVLGMITAIIIGEPAGVPAP